VKSWVSLHVYYNKDPRELLTECVGPLLDELRGAAILERAFFIRYFEGGSHVRLRLLPSAAGAAPELEARARSAIGAYLTRRPSLLGSPDPFMPPMFSRWFELEYGADRLREVYGPEGRIPFFPNNSIRSVEYRPEYGRYGGAAGVDLAERHFETSSNVALGCLREANAHVRSILLGHAIQLMQIALLVLLRDEAAMREFLSRYEAHWIASYEVAEPDGRPQLEPKYRRLAAGLAARYREACRTVAEGAAFGTATATRWRDEMVSLRARLEEAWTARALEVPSGVGTFDAAMAYLLPSYVHMTNNRLGVRIVEEAYLAYLLRRTIEDAGAA
jgi:thiopeptide-type bacteriocin biosynthesis protein